MGEEKRKKKGKKLLFILGSIFLVAVITTFDVFYVLYHDKNRNKYKSTDITISEIVKKNYINGFKDISSNGVFSFILPKEDINRMLSIGYKTNSKKRISSLYYDEDNGHNYFYVDLKPRLFKTRLVIDTQLSAIDYNEKTATYQIVNITKGKLSVYNKYKKKNKLKSSYIDKIFLDSGLPFKFIEDTYCLSFSPYSYLEQFPYLNIDKTMFEIAKEKPAVFSINQNNLGFSVDFSSFRNQNHQDSSVKTPVIDISKRLEDAMDQLDCDSLTLNTPTPIASLTEKEFSDFFREGMDTTLKETITSSYLANVADFDFKDIQINVLDSATLEAVVVVSINGYEVDMNIPLTLHTENLDFKFTLFVGDKVTTSNIEFRGEKIANNFISYLVDSMREIANEHNDICLFSSSNKSLTFDFNQIFASITDIDKLSLDTNVSLNGENHTIDFNVIKTF